MDSMDIQRMIREQQLAKEKKQKEVAEKKDSTEKKNSENEDTTEVKDATEPKDAATDATTRPEPFPEQEGLNDYDTVDNFSKELEYGGTKVVKEKDGEELKSIEELREERNRLDNEKAQEKSKESPKREPQQTRRLTKKTQTKDVVQLRDVPMSVFGTVKSMFGHTNLSQKDMITAYILVTSDEDIPDDVSDSVYQVVTEHREEKKDVNPLQGILRELRQINQKVLSTEKRSKTLELGMAYMTAERLGWSKSDKTTPERADLREDAVIKYLSRMRSESNQLINQENIKKGRPLK